MSMPSGPAITASMRALSRTFAVIGPAWSRCGSSGAIPVYGTSPQVGFMPTTPHSAAGMRIDPPWSPPIASSQSPAATTAADPDDDPPAEWPRRRGLCTGPRVLVWLPPERQKFSQCALPARVAPASSRRVTIVASTSAT
jgi:hypothetical protein